MYLYIIYYLIQKLDWRIIIIKNFKPLSFRERSHLGERDRDNCVSSGVELVTAIDSDNRGGGRAMVVL